MVFAKFADRNGRPVYVNPHKVQRVEWLSDGLTDIYFGGRESLTLELPVGLVVEDLEKAASVMPISDQIESDNDTLRDSEVALMDAIKTLCEVFIAKRITTPEALGGLFGRQGASYPPTMPKATFVMQALCDFVLDPQRKENRRLIEQFQAEPPAGSA